MILLKHPVAECTLYLKAGISLSLEVNLDNQKMSGFGLWYHALLSEKCSCAKLMSF